MKVKQILAAATAALMVTGLAACGNASGSSAPESSTSDSSTANGGTITVVSREDGSGTRGAFVELFGIEQEDESGEDVDMTTIDAQITNSTAVMMTTVSGNTSAIGYISLGSLNDTVKAVRIDGAEASVDSIKSGDYKVSRPFHIATGETVSDAAADFIGYIMSAEGQAVVEENGYISVAENAAAYAASGASGDVVIGGSSSVSPVMQKLIEAYGAVNTEVRIELQTSDSTTGMTSVIDGVCDIGMASRDLKDSELEAGLQPTVIAQDGIAVIVNNESPVDALTSEQVMQIFTGEITDWSAIG